MERDMDAELRFHLEAFAEDLVRIGIPREEALRAVLLCVLDGGVVRVVSCELRRGDRGLAAVRRGVPCVTTAAGLAAAVQGIEAIIRGEVGVRSLQEHAALVKGDPERSSAPAGPLWPLSRFVPRC